MNDATRTSEKDAAQSNGFDGLLLDQGVIIDLNATSKKHLFQELARHACEEIDAAPSVVLGALLERERLGTTGVGSGVAIPHVAVAGLDRVRGLFARLGQPIEFDAPDEKPVDLVFMLLAPEDINSGRLKTLARTARALRRPEFREQLREAPSADAIRALLGGDAVTAGG